MSPARTKAKPRSVRPTSISMHIVYFGQTPSQGTGSPITILRHLQRFAAEGHRISVIGEWGAPSTSAWPVLRLPHRRFWWPPFGANADWLRAWRMRLWAGESARVLGERPTAVLTYLGYHSGLLSEVAAHYARRFRLPLSTIVHDDVAAFPSADPVAVKATQQRYRWILEQAHRNWFVSEELAAAYGQSGGEDAVLLPIPEGTNRQTQWRTSFADRPVIVSAGFLYDEQIPLLTRLARIIDRAGGHLLLLTRETPALRDLCTREPITLKALLPSNSDALDFVATEAAGFLTAYCDRVEEMPWIRSSYPSKVVEFSHAGLPMLFVSPAASAIHRWNVTHAVPYNFTPDQEAGISDFVGALQDPAGWEKAARSTRDLAEADFDPVRIHARLAGTLVGA